MKFSIVLTTALGWILFVLGNYFANNFTYLGAGGNAEIIKNDPGLSFGYFFSSQSIHFLIIILLLNLIFYGLRYYSKVKLSETLNYVYSPISILIFLIVDFIVLSIIPTVGGIIAALALLIYVGSLIYLIYEEYSKVKKKKETDSILKIKPATVVLGFIVLVFVNLLLVLFIRDTDTINYQTGIFSYFKKVVPILIFLSTFFFTNYGIGATVLKVLKVNISKYLYKIGIAISIGLIVNFLVILIIGSIGLFIPIVMLLVILFELLIGSVVIYEFFRDYFFKNQELNLSRVSIVNIILFSVISIILVNNFHDLIRPIGVAWDDLTRYLNYPNLFAESGLLPTGNFGWPYMVFTALGFLFGGVIEYSHLFAFSIVFFFQTYLIFGVLALGDKLELKNKGLFTLAFFLTTPMILQHIVFDTKTDIPLTGFLTFSLLAALLALNSKKHKFKFFVLAGLLSGMALGVKITAIIGIVIILSIILYKVFGKIAVLLNYSVFFIISALFGTSFFESSLLNEIRVILIGLSLVLLLISIGILIYQKFKIENEFKFYPKKQLLPVVLFVSAVIIGFVPTLGKNLIDANFRISVNNTLVGVNTYPDINDADFYEGIERCEKQGFTEEVVRYIGFDQSISKYALLPWNLTMNTEIGRSYVDVSFIALAAFGGLGLIYAYTKVRNKIKNYKQKSDYRFDSDIPIYILIALLTFVVWTFVGQSIPWYGMFLYLFILIIVEMLYTSISFNLFERLHLPTLIISLTLISLFGYIIAGLAHDLQSGTYETYLDPSVIINIIIFGYILIITVMSLVLRRFYEIYFNSILLGIFIFSIVTFLGFRAYNSANNLTLAYSSGKINSNYFVDKSLYGYRYLDCVLNGNVWIAAEFSCYTGYYDEASHTNPVYRIGTFVPFFIDHNDTRLFEDSRLDKINCLLEQKEPKEALEHLQNLGFEYLVYDTNSETIETDPDGPVHQKVNRFESWINTLRKSEDLVLCDIENNPSIEVFNLNKLADEYAFFNNCKVVRTREEAKEVIPGESEEPQEPLQSTEVE